MFCPRCHERTEVRELPGGGSAFVCEHCGWGRERAEQGAAGPAAPALEAGAFAKLGLCWAGTLLIVFGPYAALWFAADHWMRGQPALDEAADRFLAALNTHYWFVLAVYLVIAWLVTPSFDRDNMGIFGRGRHWNPAFTPEQQHNRFMYKLAMWLLPGKFVVFTLRATWELGRTALVRG